MRAASLLLASALMVGQASSTSAQPACTAPQKPMLDVELMLGRSATRDWRWQQFLAREVTPRFPDGLTVYETTGQWRDPANSKISRERSRVLRMLVPAEPSPQARIDEIAAAYKSQFGQKSVGIIMRPACVSF